MNRMEGGRKMRKKIVLSFVLLIVALFKLDAFSANGFFGGGDGSLGNPYLIEDADDLNAVRNNLSAHYKMIADVDLISYENWLPIGDNSTTSNRFSGTFDGNGFAISNLNINRVSVSYIGMFGYVEGGTIRNLGLRSGDIAGRDYTGSIIGLTNNGLIENTYSYLNVKGRNYVGGIVGHLDNGIDQSILRNSFSSGTIEGIIGVGGLVGSVNSASILDSFALNDSIIRTSGTSTSFGRILGVFNNSSGSEIRNYASSSMLVMGNNIGNGSISDKNGADIGVSESESILMELFDSPYLVIDFSGGAGTEEDPYLISNPYQLHAIRRNMTSHFKLVNNIDLNGYFENWYPIGDNNLYFQEKFTGTLDGNGFEVENLTINRPSMNYVGLFGYIESGVVNNLGLKSGDIVGRDYTGSIIGRIDNGLIENTYSYLNVKGRNYVGGIVGHLDDGIGQSILRNSFSSGTIEGIIGVGGLVGSVNSASILDSFALNDSIIRTSGTSTSFGRILGVFNNSSGSEVRNYANSSMLVMGSTIGNGSISDKNGADIGALESASILTELFNSPYLITDFSGGTGTEEDPYLISNPYQLHAIKRNLTSHFRLMNNIDLNGYFENWYPIGDNNLYFQERFTGTIDGNGFEIENLSINRPSMNYIGLFGYIEGGTISNLGLKSGNIEGRDYTGSIVGRINNGLIENTYSYLNVKGRNEVGGIVGYLDNGIGQSILRNSFSSGKIDGADYVGGLVGSFYNSSILDSFALNDSIIRTSGTSTRFGRVFGGFRSGSGSEIRNYANSSMLVIGNTVGNGSISDKNGLNISEEESKRKNTYTELLEQNNGSSWDFINLWKIDEDTSFPYFNKFPPGFYINIKNKSIDEEVNISEDGNAYSNFQINAELLLDGTLYSGSTIRWEVEIWRINENGVEIFPNERIVERVNNNNTSSLNFSKVLKTDVNKLNKGQRITQRFSFRLNVFLLVSQPNN
jgi:uncharacterized protein (UPF0297 family)